MSHALTRISSLASKQALSRVGQMTSA